MKETALRHQWWASLLIFSGFANPWGFWRSDLALGRRNWCLFYANWIFSDPATRIYISFRINKVILEHLRWVSWLNSSNSNHWCGFFYQIRLFRYGFGARSCLIEFFWISNMRLLVFLNQRDHFGSSMIGFVVEFIKFWHLVLIWWSDLDPGKPIWWSSAPMRFLRYI